MWQDEVLALGRVYFKELRPIYHIGALFFFPSDHVTSFKSLCTFFALWQLSCSVCGPAKSAGTACSAKVLFQTHSLLFAVMWLQKSTSEPPLSYPPEVASHLKGWPELEHRRKPLENAPWLQSFFSTWLSVFKDKKEFISFMFLLAPGNCRHWGNIYHPHLI